jgi:hypothetical protein
LDLRETRIPYLRLLFGLKARLMWRVYTRRASAALGVIALVVLLGPYSIGVAIGCAAGFAALGPEFGQHLLQAVLLGMYLLWLLSAVFGYSLREEFDLSKLLLYPLTERQLLTGVLLGTVLDFGFLFIVPTVLVVVASFSRSLIGFLLVASAVGLFLFHTLALFQALTLVGTGMLRSRRARDLMVVLVPLLSMVIYVGSQTMAHRATRVDWSALLNGPVWRAVAYTPPGIAARAISGARQGEVGVALGGIALLAALAVLSLYFAGWLLHRVYTGETTGGAVKREARTVRVRNVGRSGFLASLPPVVAAVAEKEYKYLLREPYFKAMLVQSLYMLVMIGFMMTGFRANPMQLSVYGSGMVWIVMGVMLFGEASVLFNLLGTEGAAASLLFLYPASRRDLLLGKNLTLFAALGLLNLLVTLALCALTQGMASFPVIALWALLTTAVFVSVGNLVSIWAPIRMVMKGWRLQPQSASRGCTYSLFYLLFWLGSAVVAAPVLAAFAVPGRWISPLWFALTVPGALAYVYACYALSLQLGEQWLLQREPEIVAQLSETD